MRYNGVLSYSSGRLVVSLLEWQLLVVVMLRVWDALSVSVMMVVVVVSAMTVVITVTTKIV